MGIENQLFLSSGKIVCNQFSEWELGINDFSQLGFQIIITLNQFPTLGNVNSHTIPPESAAPGHDFFLQTLA